MGLIFSDIPELEGSNTEICLSNLASLERQLEAVIEERLAHLCELSDAIVSDGEDEDIIKSIILSIKSDGKADSGNVISENRHIADVIFQKLSTVERLAVFKEVFGKLNSGTYTPEKLCSDTVVEVSDAAADRIAYIKNSYNDTAYMQFSSLLKSPRAAYFNSVTDVCESVLSGKCEFCIMPIETSSGGKLISFYELIFKYKFKIVSVCDLHSDGEYTRYALLSKRFVNLLSVKSKHRNRHFEIVVSNAANERLEDILIAAEFCSLKLCRMDTLNLHTENNESDIYFCLAFNADGADMQTFVSYLKVDCPELEPIGFYNQI